MVGHDSRDPRWMADVRRAMAILYGGSVAAASWSAAPGDDEPAPPPGAVPPSPPPHRLAHDYLLQFQTRNVRRRLQSLQQRLRDTATRRGQPPPPPQQPQPGRKGGDAGPTEEEIVVMGSSWLACIAILLLPLSPDPLDHHNAHSPHHDPHAVPDGATVTEKLFVAQCLLHRIRRVKLLEAVDLEMEIDHDLHLSLTGSEAARTTTATRVHQFHRDRTGRALATSLRPDYAQWIATRLPTIDTTMSSSVAGVQRVLHSWPTRGSPLHPPPRAPPPSTKHHEDDDDEGLVAEQIVKGELMLLTLIVIAMDTAGSMRCAELSASSSSSLRPLLTTLGSIMATLAIRLRYLTRDDNDDASVSLPRSFAVAVEPGPHHPHRPSQPRDVLAIVTHAFQFVAHTLTPPVSDTASRPLRAAVWWAFHATVQVVPEIVMGGSGGARARFSVDPHVLQSAAHELRTRGVATLGEHVRVMHHVGTTREQGAGEPPHDPTMTDLANYLLLTTCERWTRYLPTTHLVVSVIPLLQQHLSRTDPHPHAALSVSNDRHHHLDRVSPLSLEQAALALFTTICESACAPLNDVLATYAGLVEGGPSQPPHAKKRQSSKSKKRHSELLGHRTTDDHFAMAQHELRDRGALACQITAILWPAPLAPTFQSMIAASTIPGTKPSTEVTMPWLTAFVACASACLPHVVRYYSVDANAEDTHAQQLLSAISVVFRNLLCNHDDRNVQAMAFEPLYLLHAALVEHLRKPSPDALSTTKVAFMSAEFRSLIVDHFTQCLISFATNCRYPHGYFSHDHWTLESDHDLEVERNDVRDLIRHLTGSGESGATSEVDNTTIPLDIPLEILGNLVVWCNSHLQQSILNKELVREPIAHAFSAMAKPLNQVAAWHASTGGGTNATTQILSNALTFLYEAGSALCDYFDNSNRPLEAFATSRLVCLAISSMAPMLASLCLVASSFAALANQLQLVVAVSVKASVQTIRFLPELMGESILGHSLYDIRGAMRSPGGEDHVGVLALVRLVFENPHLTRVTCQVTSEYLSSLVELHQDLKRIDFERGRGVVHGKGVTPKSRRLLLKVICNLESTADGTNEVSNMLSNLLSSTIDSVLRFDGITRMDSNLFYEVAETAFDISSFSPAVVYSFFSQNESEVRCAKSLETMTRICITVYRHPETFSLDEFMEWNRLRAALVLLLRQSANPDLPQRAIEMLKALVEIECGAVHQCFLGDDTHYRQLFTEDVISPEHVPAGCFIWVLNDLIQANKDRGVIPKCLDCAFLVKDPMIRCITLPRPEMSEQSFVDPRATLAEIWFAVHAKIALPGAVESRVEATLLDTCTAAICLLFNPSMSKTYDKRSNDPGMSFDGPQTLMVLQCLSRYFERGPSALNALAHSLLTIIPIDTARLLHLSNDHTVHGIAIVGASLFRVVQGALPPWAVEAIPDVFKSLFVALNRDPGAFELILRVSMEVHLRSDATSRSLGSVEPGQPLCRYFSTMSAPARDSFLQNATVLCRQDTISSWRMFKAITKQACGGKKKDTDFRQKPSLTRWEFDRV